MWFSRVGRFPRASLSAVSVSLLALFAASSLYAQVSIEPRSRPKTATGTVGSLRADLRVDVPLVVIPVHVTNLLGASVTGLNKENFRLFEDGLEQRIAHFSSEDAPLAVGFLFDTSGSMKYKMPRCVEAVTQFLKDTNPDDEFFLVRFGERPKLAVPLTQDVEQVRLQLARTKTLGRTSLFDAIHIGLVEMKHARNLRKAIVILSDGGDNHSRYTESEIRNIVRESDVQIYAIGIFDPDDSPKRPVEERNGPHLLSDLAAETGGKHFPVDKIEDLPDVCARISAEIRAQYLLGYSPVNAAQDGKYRRVKVQLTAPETAARLRVFYRIGYSAPYE